jgi:hypothetical protein
MRKVKLSNVANSNANNTSVEIQDAATGSTLEIADCEWTLSGNGFPIQVTGTTTVNLRALILRNLKVNAPSGGGFTIGLLNVPAGVAIPVIFCDALQSNGQAYLVGQLGAAHRVVCEGVYAEVGHLGYARILSTAAVTFAGAAAAAAAEQVAVASGTPTVKGESFGFRCDVSTLSRATNSMAYNTNAALACGAGPVVCDGTSWKHVFTGATY